jgi:hypothetical protein
MIPDRTKIPEQEGYAFLMPVGAHVDQRIHGGYTLVAPDPG